MPWVLMSKGIRQGFPKAQFFIHSLLVVEKFEWETNSKFYILKKIQCPNQRVPEESSGENSQNTVLL